MPSNMFNPFRFVLLTFSNAVLLLWVFFYLCFVSVMLFCMLIAALWSAAGEGLTFWLSCMWCCILFLSLSRVLSWVRWNTWLYEYFLILVYYLLWILASFIDYYLYVCLYRTMFLFQWIILWHHSWYAYIFFIKLFLLICNLTATLLAMLYLSLIFCIERST